MFNDPKEGDLFSQRAIIIERKSPPIGRATLTLHVSDEHGQISEPKTPGFNLTTIFEDNFDEQFNLDPYQPEVFIRIVKIVEYAPNDGLIYFNRLDRTGKILPINCKEKSEKFLKTHFLCQDNLSAKKMAAEEPIIDLNEEAT